jgi:hypothetical protein
MLSRTVLGRSWPAASPAELVAPWALFQQMRDTVSMLYLLAAPTQKGNVGVRRAKTSAAGSSAEGRLHHLRFKGLSFRKGG